MALTPTAQARDGCELSYEIRSNPDKPRIVLIHSLAMSRAMWDEVVGQLQDEAEILLCDCRGHGRSSRRPGPYTIDLFVDDLATILDDCGWATAAIAGCSMGGCIAQAFAASHPARTRSLALIDTTSWYGPAARTDWSIRAAKAAEDGLASMLDFQFSRWFSDGYRHAHPERTAALAEVFLANDLSCYQAACEMLGHLDLRPVLGMLHLPTAVVVGEEDYATPVDMAQGLHDAISGSTLTVISAARHLTPVQCPEEVAAVLRQLLV